MVQDPGESQIKGVVSQVHDTAPFILVVFHQISLHDTIKYSSPKKCLLERFLPIRATP